MKKNDWGNSPQIAITVILCLMSIPSVAEIYQWTDNEGKMHFSDTKPTDPKIQERVKQRNEANLPGISSMEPTKFREPIKIEEHSPTFAATTNTSNSPAASPEPAPGIIVDRQYWRREEIAHHRALPPQKPRANIGDHRPHYIPST